MRTAPPLVAPLFRSDGQARLLAELFLSAADELNLNELAQRAGLAYGTVHREVRRLLDAGLLSERRVGQARFVRPNPGSPLTQPVRDLLLVSAGPVPLLAAELSDIAGVETAFLYGSFAARMRGEHGTSPNDIDLMVVGMPDLMVVYEACRRVGDQVGREINPTIMTPEELGERSGFLAQVRDSPTVPVIGDLPWP
ncbi:helix-turn-helix domain-containing protein [Blastococcus tunisiensis]|uniref:IclR helix-turn-helix domain-containing protein n=1 Tax=Blastococcus tunisiensis TaxID=1798228 RepID=A0A1I2BB72_9ACTN|nr:helix-turn-helix domain-containing protein [Blastococcus sp. DSM 46838]SFE53227.1 IclR helix-turn-helix domain-containing protein [Blastococcus sp. DSM 46838]